MNQFVIGMIPFFLIMIIRFFLKRFKLEIKELILHLSLMLLSGLWAIIPDLPRVIGMNKLYIKLSKTEWINIFWFHYSIDKAESGNFIYAYFIFIIIATVSTAIVVFQLKHLEVEK